MTVCLTGDVHHMSMETRDQAYMDRTEVEAAIEYAGIGAEYDVPVTLFCTGKCVEEEPARMERLAAMDNVEIGGHNYWAFTTPVHTAWRALGKATGGRVGSWNGPRSFQRWEVRKTISALESLGCRIRCWRDHAYRYDRHTIPLLAGENISHISEPVEPSGRLRTRSGVTVVPINTPPDHEHVYHAFRTPDYSADEPEKPFGSAAYQPTEWASWVLDHVEESVGEAGFATLLLHPACMDLTDGFETLHTVLDAIADSETGTIPEIDPERA